jgi:hypothetical protein
MMSRHVLCIVALIRDSRSARSGSGNGVITALANLARVSLRELHAIVWRTRVEPGRG